MSTILKLTVTSPTQTFTEPVTLTEIKSFCEIPTSDTTRDTMLTAYGQAAREVAELRQQRDLVTKQWDLWLSDWQPYIQLRDNTTSIDRFRYRNSAGDYTSMVEGTDYEFDTALSILTPRSYGTWPTATLWPSSGIEIRFTVTPPTISEQVKLGMLYLCSQWYVNRVPVELSGLNIAQYPYALSLLDHGKEETV